jgi:hypothetical protein
MLEGGANRPRIDTGCFAAFESEIKRASPMKEARPVVLSSVIWHYTCFLNGLYVANCA